MRVGLDGYPLSQPRTGVGHYTFELARALARNFPSDEFELVSPKPFDTSVIAEAQREAIPNLHLTKAKSSSIRGHWWSIGLPLYAKRADFEVFHGTNYELPLWRRRRTVVTVHDLSTLTHPEMHRPSLARRMRARLPLTVRMASAIITPTQTIKRELCERLRVKPEKITAIHEAPRRSFWPMTFASAAEVRKRLNIEDNFFLFVGTLEPRKNLITLLKAFKQLLQETTLRPQLVIAGGEGWLMEETSALMQSGAIRERVRVIGYADDEDLRALYSSCRAFVYPSLYEGFGLPPLEAMACAAPVIASRIPALQASLGDAAILIDPFDVESFTRNLTALLIDETRRTALRKNGLKHAAQFSWDEAARATYRVYESVR